MTGSTNGCNLCMSDGGLDPAQPKVYFQVRVQIPHSLTACRCTSVSFDGRCRLYTSRSHAQIAHPMAGCGVPSPQYQLTPKVYGILPLAVLAGMAARTLSSPSIDPAPGFLPARSWLPALWFVSPCVWRVGVWVK